MNSGEVLDLLEALRRKLKGAQDANTVKNVLKELKSLHERRF